MNTRTPVPYAPVPFQLADGTAVRLRPVASTDGELFKQGLRSLSPESRYLRFLAYTPWLSEDLLRYLTAVDQTNHVAWVAVTATPSFAPGLGVARFVRMPAQPAIAEFAIVVIDAMQGKGLGRTLLAMLHLLAAERGIETLRAVCLPENRTMLNWLRRLGAKSSGCPGETVELDLHVARTPRFSGLSSSSESFASVLEHLRQAHSRTWKQPCSPGPQHFISYETLE